MKELVTLELINTTILYHLDLGAGSCHVSEPTLHELNFLPTSHL